MKSLAVKLFAKARDLAGRDVVELDWTDGETVADLKRRAADIGLDTARFNDCLDSGRHAAGWQLDRALGQRLGVSATPTFFINGRMVAGALPFESFRDVVSDELERRKALP